MEDMNEGLIANWNSRVRNGDTVFHCGDFAFTKDHGAISAIVKRLNGHIFLIRGNHDCDKVIKKVEGFAWVGARYQNKFAKVDKQLVFCSHYAHRVWDHAQHGAFHVFGHSHNGLADDPTMLSCDVGVDAWNCFPVSFEELREVMAKKVFVPVDHHGKAE